MNNRHNSFVPFNTAGKKGVNKSRRTFLKQSSIVAATMSLSSFGIASPRSVGTTEQSAFNRLSANSMGFNGQRQDPVSRLYHLGNGYRTYNPGLMRFHAADSMSPFGRGGINSYAYALGDPINLRDPSGHFALLSLLVGAIVGAVIGAAVSAFAEGIRAAATGDKFDLKQVAIGTALGFLGGGFGAAAVGAKTGVQVGLAVADAVVSGAADFGLNVAAGTNPRDSGINAGIGAAIGLVTFGLGKGIGKAASKLSKSIGSHHNTAFSFINYGNKKIPLTRRLYNLQTQGLGGKGGPEAGKSFAAEAYSTLRKSLFGTDRVGAPIDINSRKIIQDAFSSVPAEEMAPFSKSLDFVNTNLASHGDQNLSINKAIAYRDTALKVNRGEVSNAYAHLEAANRWAGSTDVPRGVRFVGTSMNLAGSFFSGVIDANKRNMGKF